MKTAICDAVMLLALFVLCASTKAIVTLIALIVLAILAARFVKRGTP